MNNLDNLRERFEENAKSKSLNLDRHKHVNDDYAYIETQDAWELYQSAHISAVKQCAEMCEAVIECYRIKACCTGEVAIFEEAIPECKAQILELLPKENSDE